MDKEIDFFPPQIPAGDIKYFPDEGAAAQQLLDDVAPPPMSPSSLLDTRGTNLSPPVLQETAAAAARFGSDFEGSRLKNKNYSSSPSPLIRQTTTVSRPVAEDNTNSSSSMFSTIIIGIIVVAAVIVFGYIFYTKFVKKSGSDSSSSNTRPPPLLPEETLSQNIGGGGVASGSGGAMNLTQDVWASIAGPKNHPRCIVFTSAQCGHCTNMKPELAKAVSASVAVPIYNLEYTPTPQDMWKQHVMQQSGVNAFPTIRYIPAGVELSASDPAKGVREFSGPRTQDALVRFAQNGGAV